MAAAANASTVTRTAIMGLIFISPSCAVETLYAETGVTSRIAWQCQCALTLTTSQWLFSFRSQEEEDLSGRLGSNLQSSAMCGLACGSQANASNCAELVLRAPDSDLRSV
jgi:hypothetical protein